MKKSIIIITLMMLGLCFAGGIGRAQTTGSSVGIVKTPDSDKEILKKTKPEVPKTPQVPNFILKDNSGKFIMALGGYIQPIVGWDLSNDLPSGFFIPSIIPVPAVKGQKSAFFSTPLYSTFDLNVIGLPGTENQVTGYVNVRFIGPSKTAQVQDLYVTYRGIRAGLGFSIMTDGASMPNTIDPQGPNGAICAYTYQVGYFSKAYKGVSFGVGMELPSYDNYKGVYDGKDYPEFDGDKEYGNASQSCPDFAGYLQYQGKGANRVRVSGIVRNFRYVDLLHDKVSNVFGWGVELSGNLQPCKALTLYYQGSYGHGIGNYIQDLSGLPCSYIPKEEPGSMKASPMVGWFGGFSINLSPKVSVGGVFSQARVWDSGTYYSDYKYGLYGEGNVMYNITPYLQWGIEYIYGRHTTFNNGRGIDNRIQTALMFSL